MIESYYFRLGQKIYLSVRILKFEKTNFGYRALTRRGKGGGGHAGRRWISIKSKLCGYLYSEKKAHRRTDKKNNLKTRSR